MTTVQAAPGPRTAGLRTPLIARAVVCAALAAVATFDQGHLSHPAEAVPFGLTVVGLFEPLQGLALLTGVRTARSRRARVLLAIRVAALIVVGLLALVLPVTVRGAGASVVLLVVLEVVAFLVGGVLELLGGLAPGESAVQRRDAVTMGGLQIVAGAMLAVVSSDAIFAVGVLGTWGAIAAVYLGIAAASVGRPGVR